MKKIFLTITAAISMNCANAQTHTVYPRAEVKCMGVELDGSQTLRVQGYGRNRSDAKEQAMKNAVWAVVFDGVRDGAAGCDMRPLVTEANARERYADYFNIFFADNGEYRKYVSMRDTKRGSGVKAKDKLGYSYNLTVRVLRPELKSRLEADSVIGK